MAALQYNCDAGLAKAPTFHPSLWGDFFLTYQPPTAPQVTVSLETEDKDHAWLNAVKKRTDTFLLQQAYMKERAGLLKEEVREIIKGTNELPKILDLIVTLQRLGLDNHYEIEIDEHLLCLQF
jgi:beta-farnesene synthase